jgi:hypothetical protein
VYASKLCSGGGDGAAFTLLTLLSIKGKSLWEFRDVIALSRQSSLVGIEFSWVFDDCSWGVFSEIRDLELRSSPSLEGEDGGV